MMKNILHITVGNSIGGLDMMINRLLKFLKNNNNNIIYWNSKGFKIYRKYYSKKVFSLSFNGNFFFVNLFNSIKSLIRSDIIHVHNTDAWILLSPLFLFNNKTIYSFHGNFGSNLKKNIFIKFIIFLIINYVSVFSKKIIFLTNGQKENLIKYCIFKNKLDDKCVIIPNFIEKEKIILRKERDSMGIIFVGRYTLFKGFNDLIRLTEILDETPFFLVGDDKFQSKKSNVNNLGKIENSLILKEYDKASIFLLPSYTEAFPVTILEAMARGLVILVSDIPGMREIVKEGRNGFLFPPGDIQKMKEIILYLKENPKEVKRISKNNLKDIWEFITEKQISKYLKIYSQLTNDKKSI